MKDRNLEEQLAEKLGNRSIAPSQEAWERIARNRQQGKDNRQEKKKKIFLYYAVAAAVCVLFGGFVYLMQGSHNDTITGPTMVDSGKENTINDSNSPVDVPVNEVPLKRDKTGVISYESSKSVVTVGGVYHEREESTLVTESKPGLKENNPEIAAVSIPVIKAPTKEELYEAEVNYLLKNAIKEVAADKHLSKPTDNTALLKEVETEMDEYYRDKAMNIFSLKNKKIRFAVKE